MIEWLKAEILARPIGVDREKKILRGYVVAQEGAFKTPGRGEFDLSALKDIRAAINATDQGIKSRLGHPTMSDDGIGKFLGRAKNAVMGDVRVSRDGKPVTLRAVRADLHFDPTASRTPNGDLATYLMDLAENDPDAFSSSLVVEVDEEIRLNKDGTEKKDEDGNPLPPIWHPKQIHASDIVDTGDAVDGILSAQLDALGMDLDSLLRFDGPARIGVQVLDKVFAKHLGRDIVEARLRDWVTKYLTQRYGEEKPVLTPTLDKWSLRMREHALFLDKTRATA